MVTQLTGQNLPQSINDVRDAELPGMSSFAKGLEQDIDAVTQGLTSRWNSGPGRRPRQPHHDQEADVRASGAAAAP
jgi:hypothetical protein